MKEAREKKYTLNQIKLTNKDNIFKKLHDINTFNSLDYYE